MNATRVLAVALSTVVASCSPGGVDTAVAGAATAHVRGVACGDDVVGTAVLVGDALAVTNAHVVAGLEVVELVLRGGAVGTAVPIGFDPESDLALLRTESPDLFDGVDPVVLSDPTGSDTGLIVTVSEDGLVDTQPFGVRRLINATGPNIYREGETSRRALDVDADIGPGDSGAGLFNEAGEVVGIAFASSRNNDNVTYAVSAAEVRQFVDANRNSTMLQTGPCTR